MEWRHIKESFPRVKRVEEVDRPNWRAIGDVVSEIIVPMRNVGFVERKKKKK